MRLNLSCFAALALIASLEAKQIDRRNASEVGGDAWFLVFSANGGLPGHAFVAWAGEDRRRKLSFSEAFGLYPKDAKTAWMGTVPGEITRETLKGNYGLKATNLVVQVTAAQFQAASLIRAEWAAKRQYKLIEHDCVSFLSQIASSVGLKIPDRSLGTLRPADFITRLIAINQ